MGKAPLPSRSDSSVIWRRHHASMVSSESARAAASAAGGFSCIEIASAAPIEVPTVDRLAIRVLVDSSYDLFFRPAEVNGVKIAPPPRAKDFRRTLHNEWGLSLWLESERAAEKRTVMLDYGYSPGVLLNNMELTGVDPAKIDALVVSHGHYDHFGGLQGFLDKFRNVLPADVKLYAGGEDNFCHRVQGNPTQGFADFGTLDRRELTAKKVTTVLAENPVVVDQWQLEKLALVCRDKELLFHVPGLEARYQDKLWGRTFADVNEAVAAAFAGLGPNARIAVIPEGPYVLARVEEGVVAARAAVDHAMPPEDG